jgi:hypothetical protein
VGGSIATVIKDSLPKIRLRRKLTQQRGLAAGGISGVWGLPTLLSKTIIVITLDSSIVSYLGVLFHVVQSLTESQQNRSKKITKLHKTLSKRIENISKMVALFGGVINVSQGKIMYQAELKFHVKHRNHLSTNQL